MMSDLVKRLRDASYIDENTGDVVLYTENSSVLDDAADEIERLRAEVERLTCRLEGERDMHRRHLGQS
jgi:hypothetical protein